MNKKIIGTILTIIVILGIAVLTIVMIAVKNEKKEPMSTPVVEIDTKEVAPSPTIEKMKEYVDPAGFSFNYPSTVTVIPKKMSDKTFYADIEITSNTYRGNMQIVVKDTTLTTIKNWMAKEGFKPLANDIKEVALADLTATQFTDTGKIITAAIDQKILFTITTDLQKESDFWQKIHDVIISSFAVVPSEENIDTQKQTPKASAGGASDEIEGGVEEIVE